MSIMLCFTAAGEGAHKLDIRFTRDNADDKLRSHFGRAAWRFQIIAHGRRSAGRARCVPRKSVITESLL